MKITFSFFFVVVAVTFFSCGVADISRRTPKKDAVMTSKESQEPLDIYTIYDVDHAKGGEQVAFVSLSDTHYLSEHPDSLPIPDISEKPYDSIQYFKLTGKYRKRFLEGTNVSEDDKLFLYNYATGKQKSFTVKQLTVAACINVYSSENDMPFQPYYYEFGFGIDSVLVTEFNTDGYFENVLVYVGKESPFTGEPLDLIKWKKVDNSQFPEMKMGAETAEELKGSKLKETYVGTIDSLDFFVQEGTKVVYEYENQVRHIVVLNNKTKEVVFERGFVESEGIGMAPLNLLNLDYPDELQWTGRLFKDRSPVIFGFLYHSFDCERIAFIGGEQNEFPINCDNRH